MKRHSYVELTLLALLLAGAGSSAVAKETDALRPLEVDDYFALKRVGSPVVSTDGKWVAYTVSTQDLEKDSRETRVWMVAMSGGDPLPMTAKGSSAWSPRWSPDGKHLSFVATGNDGDSSQVFTLDMRGGERVQITDVDGGVEGYEWSPDGQQLVLIIRDQEPDTGTLPWVIDSLKFKEDYVGYLNRLRAHRHHITTVTDIDGVFRQELIDFPGHPVRADGRIVGEEGRHQFFRGRDFQGSQFLHPGAAFLGPVVRTARGGIMNSLQNSARIAHQAQIHVSVFTDRAVIQIDLHQRGAFPDTLAISHAEIEGSPHDDDHVRIVEGMTAGTGVKMRIARRQNTAGRAIHVGRNIEEPHKIDGFLVAPGHPHLGTE